MHTTSIFTHQWKFLSSITKSMKKQVCIVERCKKLRGEKFGDYSYNNSLSKNFYLHKFNTGIQWVVKTEKQ